MRAWLPALLLITLPAVAGPAGQLVGKTLPPYPDGLRDVGGSCLSDSDDPMHVCDYSIGLLADASDDADADPVMRYVVAGRMAGRDGQRALWKITDAQDYPKVTRGFHWQAGSCRLDKVNDAAIIAVVRHDPEQEYLSGITWARRLDLKTGKFVALDPAHVDCVNEGYGEGGE
jgi:hypothetical protein